MFINKYLTEYDDSISGESYIDPLGMLVIWSAFGQQIFKSRVNSISNDVRNYTLNLVNHYLIRRLLRDEAVLLSKRLAGVYGSKDELNFKYACLLHLESLFVYSILKHDGQKDIDSGGVLGITKARRIWTETSGNPRLIFTHEKESQILVRQLSLGVSGRYKTPLMEIGFFDGNYHYQLPDSAALWEQAEQFVANTPELHKLTETVFAHLKELLNQNSIKPQAQFKDISSTLHEAYIEAFASPGAVGRYARKYWLNVTDLDKGAAGALLDVLDENTKLSKPKDMSPQQLLTKALRGKNLQPEEAIKMQHIELLEPFLAEVSLLFALLTAKKSQALADVLAEWKRFGRDENSLPRAAQRVIDNPELIKVLTGTARFRLNKILLLVEYKTVEDQIRMLTAYHGAVMKERDQSSWLSLDETGRIKIHVRPSHTPDRDEWQSIRWINNYYLPQFKSLVFGYQGGLT